MELIVTPASELPDGPQEWLWPGYIPAGELGVFDGDPGLGKSLVTIDLAARVSRGRQWPDGAKGKGRGANVLLFSSEDQGRTIRRRLRGAGADLDRTKVVESDLLLPQDAAALAVAVQKYRPRLVILDPLMSYLGVNAYQDQAVRTALKPLRTLAQSTGCSFIFVRHKTKTRGANAKMAGGGSVGIIGQGRFGFSFDANPQDPTRRVMAGPKQNLDVEPPSLGYHIVSKNDVPAVEWEGVVQWAADDLAARPATKGQRKSTRFVDELLADLLAEAGGWAEANDLYFEANDRAKITKSQLWRAMERNDNIHVTKGTGPLYPAWIWYVTGHEPPRS